MGKRIGVISDIHSNYEALWKVLSELEALRADEVWCLGDLVGYGASPNECVDAVREACSMVLAGNHDLGVVGKLDFNDFSFEAKVAGEWTKKVLNQSQRSFLEELRPAAMVTLKGLRSIYLMHGSPRRPDWGYIFTEEDAKEAVKALEEDKYSLGLFGHTHLAVKYIAYSTDEPFSLWEDKEKVSLCEAGEIATAPLLLNPGSVGQPRDYNPKASFALIEEDTREITLHRVEYDVELASEKIIEEGLPIFLARRLRMGI